MKRQEGETDAPLEEAFRRRDTRLRDVAMRAGTQDIEDLYQDAFVRIVERSHSLDFGKLDNLLRHVVRCFAIDRHRRNVRRLTFTSDKAGENAVDAAADPERHVMGAQRLMRVMATIDAMPSRRREVFLMHRIEEKTYAQIARQLEINIKTVEKHMALAMRQLSDADD